MTSTEVKFGELAIRPSSFDSNNDYDDGVGGGGNLSNNESYDLQSGFSNIDLNGSNSPSIENFKQPSINSNSNYTNNSSLGYTSFGEALNENSSINNISNPQMVRSSTTQYKISNNNTVTSLIPNDNKDSIIINNDGNRDGSTFSFSNANGMSMLSTASDASSKLALKTVTTLELMRQWSKSAYKCTRQIVNEKLGKSSKTLDPELDTSIENLRELKKKYENILGLAKNLTNHFTNVLTTQKTLADSFAELAQKSPELNDEFTSNSEVQRSLIKQGEVLINGIKTFTSNLNTLCSKTIEDTLTTIRNYEAARLEYDANRSDIEHLKSLPENQQKIQKVSQLEVELTAFKEKYERLRKDVAIKIKFLDENRVKVMRKQLSLFQSAISSYFSGNQQALESTLNQLNSKNNSKLFKSEADDSQYKFESFLEES